MYSKVVFESNFLKSLLNIEETHTLPHIFFLALLQKFRDEMLSSLEEALKRFCCKL